MLNQTGGTNHYTNVIFDSPEDLSTKLENLLIVDTWLGESYINIWRV